MQLNKVFLVLYVIFSSYIHVSNDDDVQIYTLVINKIVTPTPPPPPPSKGQLIEMSKKILDSIYEKPLKIAVSNYAIDFYLKNNNEGVQPNSVVIYNESESSINMDKLKARPSVLLELVDTKKRKSKTLFDNFDGLLKVSHIEYNTDKTKAITLISFSRGTLSGSLLQIFLEKQRGVWKITATKTLLTS